jgi:hypothetical protein
MIPAPRQRDVNTFAIPATNLVSVSEGCLVNSVSLVSVVNSARQEALRLGAEAKSL